MAGQRLLLVDDDPLVSRSLARGLGRHGHEVVTVAGCREARQAVGRFDVGIFDVNLDDGPGVELAAELLAAGVIGRAVFHTGSVDRPTLAAAQRVGAIVQKGAPMAELLAALDSA